MANIEHHHPEKGYFWMGTHYGSGLRLMESIRLRGQSLDFEMNRIDVIDNKGGKGRETLMPGSANTEFHQQLVVK